MTEPARLFGVFYEPGKVFADLAEKPRWLVAIIVSILFALSFSYAISSHVGWDMTIRQTLANNPRVAELPADQRKLFAAIKADESIHIDELIEKFDSELSSSEIFSALFELELNNKIRQLPGKNYVRVF